MADSENRGTKRGRFDLPASRARSRSPAPDDSRPEKRSRSPMARQSSVTSTASEQNKLSAAERARAAAAKITAQLKQKAASRTEVPVVRAAPSPTTVKSPSEKLAGEIYQVDGDFVKDIEVNDLRNRYTLTKGATQKEIKEETGADVTTRGNYYPDKSLATAANPPLYLHVTSTTKEGLEKAIAKIEELIARDLPNLVDERRFRGRREQEHVELDSFGRRKWPEENIPIDLEPISGFNLRAQVVGQQGANVKHIQQETRCRVQIKGRGSGFIEPALSTESDEPMYLHVSGPDAEMVKKAREMCEELLQTVKEDYERYKERPHRQFGDGYHNGRGGYGDRDNRGDHNRHAHGYTGGYGGRGHGGHGGHGGQPFSPGVGSPGGAVNQYDAAQLNPQWTQYAAANVDPYAAYGGYAKWQQLASIYQIAHGGAPGMPQQPMAPVAAGYPQYPQATPPPPPGSAGHAGFGAPPPPPPPGSTGSGGYGAPPPPPPPAYGAPPPPPENQGP